MANKREFLTDKEKAFAGELKKEGVLILIPKKELIKTSGSLVACGDGRKDIRTFHRMAIHCEPFTQMEPGGSLIYSVPFLNTYPAASKDPEHSIACSLERLKLYMAAQGSDELTHNFHFPCTAALNAGITIEQLIHQFVPEVYYRFLGYCRADPSSFKEEHVHYHLHLKKINSKGEEEQNTYQIMISRLLERIKIIGK